VLSWATFIRLISSPHATQRISRTPITIAYRGTLFDYAAFRAEWAARAPSWIGRFGGVIPFPPRPPSPSASEAYSIMSQSSGSALPTPPGGTFLAERVHYATHPACGLSCKPELKGNRLQFNKNQREGPRQRLTSRSIALQPLSRAVALSRQPPPI
jgi:hypothetical protein